MADFLTGDLLRWLSAHTHWLGIAIFLISLTESLAIAGLLVPGVLLLFAASALAGGGDLAFVSALLWATSGAICGDLMSFFLGRYFHQDIRRLRIFVRHPQWLARGEAFFRHYGTFSIVLGRFIGPIRPVIPMVAGMFDMPFWRFFLVNVLSAIIWAPVYITPGYLTGNAAYWTVPEFFWQQTMILLGSLAGLATLVLLLLRPQTRWGSLAAAGICTLALLSIMPTAPWLNVVYDYAQEWLNNDPLLLDYWQGALQPLTSEILLALLYIPPTLILSALREGWKLLFLTLSGLLCLALDLLPNADATHLALPLTLLWGCIVLSNRNYSFWLRMSWSFYCLPLGGALLAAWLLQPTPIPVVLTGLLQSIVAVLLAIWLTERLGPITALPNGAVWALSSWPLIAGGILLLGF